jgi:hypothetical protein
MYAFDARRGSTLTSEPMRENGMFWDFGVVALSFLPLGVLVPVPVIGVVLGEGERLRFAVVFAVVILGFSFLTPDAEELSPSRVALESLEVLNPSVTFLGSCEAMCSPVGALFSFELSADLGSEELLPDESESESESESSDEGSETTLLESLLPCKLEDCDGPEEL